MRVGPPGRGRDIAWMGHCKDCTALVVDQVGLAEDRPAGAPVKIYPHESQRPVMGMTVKQVGHTLPSLSAVSVPPPAPAT